MGAQQDAMTEGLLKAIRAETEGCHFYTMAARSTDDSKGRAVFEQLAKEEQEHARFLKHQLKSVAETGKADPDEKLGKRTDLPGPFPIFSDEIRSRAKDAHYEMTALSIGIKLELDAMEFYTSQARACEDQAMQRFFQELAGWEKGHYEALLREHEALKEDYWSGGGFSPY